MTAASAPLKVFITGASSGLGAALAAHYAVRGAVLGLAARRADKLAEIAAALATPSTVAPRFNVFCGFHFLFYVYMI